MIFSIKLACHLCAKHISNHKPHIKCDICENIYHPKCSNLKPEDVKLLVELSMDRTWSCTTCINNILPLSYEELPLRPKSSNARPRQKCHSCSKLGNRVQSCDLCGNFSHPRCFSGPLGCRSCMQDLIPGFNVDTCELLSSKSEHADKLFNPFDRNSDINNVGNMDDEQGDFEHLIWAPCSTILENCKYYEMRKVTPSRASELKIMSLNIRSIKDKITSIRDDISHYSKFDVLCFNETCCSIDLLPFGGKELELEPFHPPTVQSPARASNRGGGLIIYVNRKLCSENDCTVLTALSEKSDYENGEFLFLEINRCKGKNIIIGNMYRSPSGQPSNFIDKLEQKLDQLKRHKNKLIILTSDSNIDLLKFGHYEPTSRLVNTLAEHGFVPVVSRPTRITSHTATIIDHIFVNNCTAVTKSGIITVDLSDHLAPFVNIIIENGKCQLLEDAQFWRQISEENLDLFKKEIFETDWNFVFNAESANEKYNAFEEKYHEIYDRCFPPKNNKRKKRKVDKPWILPWLQGACDRKNKFYKIFVKNPTIENIKN